MLSLDDSRWEKLRGGYRTQFDPRPLLARIEHGGNVETAWHELWEGLHHQGDVDLASYAAVPHLARIHQARGVSDWNTYALVATIDLARDNARNPVIPDWLRADYFRAIRSLAEVGATELLRESDSDVVRAILSVLAIAAGARTHARFLIQYSDQELLEIEKAALDHLS